LHINVSSLLVSLSQTALVKQMTLLIVALRVDESITPLARRGTGSQSPLSEPAGTVACKTT